MTALTDQQRFILDLLSEGLVPKQIAVMMGLSVQTVKWHLKRIRVVLGARNTTHAVAIYLRARKASLSERARERCSAAASVGRGMGRDPFGDARSESEASPPETQRAAVASPYSPPRPTTRHQVVL